MQNPILPKILIQFGKEINKTGQMERNTSNYENVVLFSPYGLKTNYSKLVTGIITKAFYLENQSKDNIMKMVDMFEIMMLLR